MSARLPLGALPQPSRLSEFAVPPDPAGQLLALLEGALDRIVSIGLHAAVALALGSLAARLLRRCGLRWSWSLLPLVLLAPTRPLLHGWSATLCLAALSAAVSGRRRHREDLAAGGDLAESARARRGPASFARRALVALWATRRARRGPAAIGRSGLEIGRDGSARAVTIPFGRSAGHHTLVVGATGSGKTVTQTWIAERAIEAAYSVVVVDPKGDRRMRDALAAAARASGRRFVEWTPEGPWIYNPFAWGGPSEIADRALVGERFTEPHYQRQAQRYLGHAVRMLRGAGIAVSFATLTAQLDPEALERLSETVADEHASRTREYLASLTPRQRSDLAGVRDRLAIVSESDVARWLDPENAEAESFDLLDAIESGAVVYFSLRADSWPLLAQMLGVAIVGDLRGVAASLQGDPRPSVVVIDEFAALAAEQVSHLFGRARSAGINLVLATQELSDLRVQTHRQLREQVLGNLSALIAHRQVVGESAELIAELAGTVGCWRTSQASDGRWTRTRAAEPAISPERIRALPPGAAAVLDLAGARPPRLARIHAGR